MHYLRFTIENEEYALPVCDVEEILPLMWVTRIPNAPAFLEGSINLRGDLIPILDMRKRLGFERKIYRQNTRIVVVHPDKKRRMGLIIDEVNEIEDVREEDKRASLLNEGEWSSLKGAFINGERLVQIVLPQNILSPTEEKWLAEIIDDE